MFRFEGDEECTDPLSCMGGAIDDIVDGINDAFKGVTETIGFWQDPWGNTFKTMKDAASGLAHDVLPGLTSATLPDLSAEWFLTAYAIAFAVAFLVAMILLLPQFIRTARGTQSGAELGESLGLFFPLFIGGAMFGPMLGSVLVQFFHSLSDAIAAWAIGDSADTVVDELTALIDAADPAGIAGGVVVAVGLMICMVIGLFLVVLILIVQLVTLYFTGVLIPLGIVWIIDKNKRSFGLKLVGLWLGLLAAHPLLFFMLGVTFTMVASSVGVFGENDLLKALVQLLVAIIAIFMAALSPLLLMKFAPVIPAATGASAASQIPSGSWGPKDSHSAVDRYSSESVGGPKHPRTSTTSKAEAMQDDDGPNLKSTGKGAGEGAEGGLLSRAGGAGTGGAAEGVAAEGGTAATAAEGAAAAGTAESATGVGAAVGVPTLIAAGALAAGDAASKGIEKAGDYSVAAMQEMDGNDG